MPKQHQFNYLDISVRRRNLNPTRCTFYRDPFHTVFNRRRSRRHRAFLLGTRRRRSCRRFRLRLLLLFLRRHFYCLIAITNTSNSSYKNIAIVYNLTKYRQSQALHLNYSINIEHLRHLIPALINYRCCFVLNLIKFQRRFEMLSSRHIWSACAEKFQVGAMLRWQLKTEKLGSERLPVGSVCVVRKRRRIGVAWGLFSRRRATHGNFCVSEAQRGVKVRYESGFLKDLLWNW